MYIDDDLPGHVDRSDCGMTNPQARRLLRLQQSRTTANGLKDRMSVPEKRTTFAHAPVIIAPRK